MSRLSWLALAAIVAVLAMIISTIRFVPAGPEGANEQSHHASKAGAADGLLVPVMGVANAQLIDSWHDAREHGARLHEALDIAAPVGTPVVAAMAGHVVKLHQSNAGGTTAYLRSDDGKWIAYYAHLQRYADDLTEGQHVARGDRIGFVGDTGNAGAGNFHLHFALQRMKQGEKWYQGTAVNPYPMLAGKPSAR